MPAFNRVKRVADGALVVNRAVNVYNLSEFFHANAIYLKYIAVDCFTG